jgi:anti-sigma regulatory factor (Ser/Thr protein kinase)
VERYSARFRGAPGSVRGARRAVVDYAKACGFSRNELGNIEVGVGEALANAVEHGTKDLGFITVSCNYDGKMLLIDVRDDGPGFAYDVPPRRDPLSTRGFGISIMRSAMTKVQYFARGNAVRLSKERLPVVESEVDVAEDA